MSTASERHHHHRWPSLPFSLQLFLRSTALFFDRNCQCLPRHTEPCYPPKFEHTRRRKESCYLKKKSKPTFLCQRPTLAQPAPLVLWLRPRPFLVPMSSVPPNPESSPTVRLGPDILTYSYASRMVYVAPGQSYDVRPSLPHPPCWNWSPSELVDNLPLAHTGSHRHCPRVVS